MKRISYLLTSLFLCVLILSSFNTNQDDTPPYQTKSFTGSLSNVRVETSGGSISVEGGQSSGVKVDMYVRGNNWPNNLSKEDIDDRLKDYDINIATEGNTVIATAKRKQKDNWNWKNGLSISFKIYTPRTMNTDLHTSGGSIRLANVTGKQDFATSGGSLRLNDVAGDIHGRTSGGSIHLDNCRKTIDVRTSGGSIEATASSGDMHMTTSGGSVRLRDLKGQIDAHTSGGSIQGNNIDGDLKTGTSGGSVRLAGISGSLEASTSGGSIEAEITKLGQYVRLSGSAGSVRVRLPMDKGMDLDLRGNRVSTGTLRNFDGTMEKDRVVGRINGGGIPVRISASSGHVYLNE